MGKVIAVANQKGGVGKTTTTVTLGAKLAKYGYKVLLIDLDSQANLTMYMGDKQPDEIPVTIADIMLRIINDEDISIDKYILKTEEQIDFIPSNIKLSSMEISLVNAMSREYILKMLIDSIKDSYDYILIDCMPSLGMLTINAMVAADSVLIPVQSQYLSAKGLELLLESISKIKKRKLNPQLKIDGILITMYDQNTKFAKNIVEEITVTYGENIRIFQSKIPRSVKAIETSAQNSSIFEYAPDCKVAVKYAEFTEEFLDIMSKED